jgi:hypothetical protein
MQIEFLGICIIFMYRVSQDQKSLAANNGFESNHPSPPTLRQGQINSVIIHARSDKNLFPWWISMHHRHHTIARVNLSGCHRVGPKTQHPASCHLFDLWSSHMRGVRRLRADEGQGLELLTISHLPPSRTHADTPRCIMMSFVPSWHRTLCSVLDQAAGARIIYYFSRRTHSQPR